MKKRHMIKWIGMGLLIAGLAATGCLKLTDGYCDDCSLGLSESGFTLNEFGFSPADWGDISGGSSGNGDGRPVSPPDRWMDTDTWSNGSDGDWGSDGDADGDADWDMDTDFDSPSDVEDMLANCSTEQLLNIAEQCGSDTSCIIDFAREC